MSVFNDAAVFLKKAISLSDIGHLSLDKLGNTIVSLKLSNRFLKSALGVQGIVNQLCGKLMPTAHASQAWFSKLVILSIISCASVF
jgi:hypothetical protein